jgi:hypothetical protein
MNLVVVIYFNVLCCAITMSKAEYIVTFVVSETSGNQIDCLIIIENYNM